MIDLRSIASGLVALSLAACAATLPGVPADQDPSNPRAPETAPAALSTALAPEGHVPANAPAPPPISERAPAANAEHGPGREGTPDGGASTMQHARSGGGMPGMSMPGMDMGPTAAPPHESAPKGTAYTCPMHPEVTSDRPGRCPRCGMKLVPRKPADGGAP